MGRAALEPAMDLGGLFQREDVGHVHPHSPVREHVARCERLAPEHLRGTHGDVADSPAARRATVSSPYAVVTTHGSAAPVARSTSPRALRSG
jgi:hypothetical protein